MRAPGTTLAMPKRTQLPPPLVPLAPWQPERMLHCENVSRFDFAMPPAGRQSVARKLSKWKNCIRHELNSHSLHVTPTLKHSHTHTLTHFLSQSKVTTLFPCSASSCRTDCVKIRLGFGYFLETLHTQLPQSAKLTRELRVLQASQYSILSLHSLPLSPPPAVR